MKRWNMPEQSSKRHPRQISKHIVAPSSSSTTVFINSISHCWGIFVSCYSYWCTSTNSWPKFGRPIRNKSCCSFNRWKNRQAIWSKQFPKKISILWKSRLTNLRSKIKIWKINRETHWNSILLKKFSDFSWNYGRYTKSWMRFDKKK